MRTIIITSITIDNDNKIIKIERRRLKNDGKIMSR